MEPTDIIDGNRLIAKFMGFTHEYTGPLSRGGGVMDNVNLLSKVEFMTLPELLESKINNEGAPYTNQGGICIGKYVGKDFYDNVVFFSTDSQIVPTTIDYNERFQAYHNSIEWLMPVVDKIESLATLERDGIWYSTQIGNMQTEAVDYSCDHPYWDALKADEATELESPKIYSNQFIFSICMIGKYSINQGSIVGVSKAKKIDAIWTGVVKFIEWYNKENNIQ